MTKDRALSLALVLFIGVMFAETFNFPEKSDWQMYSPALYPRIILSIIGILTVILCFRSFKPTIKQTADHKDRKQNSRRAYGKIVWLFVFFGIYVILLQQLGFIIATILYLLCSQAILMGIRKPKAVILNSSVSLVATFTVYFIFTNVLQVWLP
jgi:putative tricarboxylic transport membrane protein